MTSRWDTVVALRRLQLAWIEPLIIAARKRRRLAVFGIERLDDISRGAIDLAPDTSECVSACADLIAAERRHLASYLFCGDDLGSSRLRGIPCVIDLDVYPDFAHYLRHLKKFSKGGTLREIKRAQTRGYFCKTLFRPLYQRQCFDIETSKRVRSGLVLAAVIRWRPPADFADGITLGDIAAHLGRPLSDVAPGIALPEPPLPPCLCHWTTDWGVFINETAAGATGSRSTERLVGYLFLQRVGNIVRVGATMGHGSHLAEGVMKLLFHDVMKWLLGRQDPRVRGIRYVHYGAIEHGNDGLLAWKRRFGFFPLRFSDKP